MRQSNNLNKVIECLQEQERALQGRPQGQDIEQIHNVTIGLLNTFGDHIDRCKKYNEARIHRKYENMILQLEEQNLSLKRKLELERESLPSSQSYVSDLIDRMVDLRNANDRLRKHNQSLQNQLSLYETRQEPPKKRENSTADFELSNESMLIRDAIAKYTRSKRQEGPVAHKQDYNLLRFIEFNSTKTGKWTIFQLFQRLDKWMGNMRDVRFIDSQRLRQNLERTYSSIEQTHPTFSIGQTVREEGSRLVKVKTENMGSFVNDRFTMVRKKPGQALYSSLIRHELASKSEKRKAGRN